MITSSFAVGQCYSGIYEWACREFADKRTGLVDFFLLPVVGETYDGFLTDIAHSPITSKHVVNGIDEACGDSVPEGCVGGGTGMICCGFKSGTGSASRVIPGFSVVGKDGRGEGDGKGGLKSTQYTIGALVQANFGAMRDFRIGGAPFGRWMVEENKRNGITVSTSAAATAAAPTFDAKPLDPQAEVAEEEGDEKVKDGSIIVILATDAPLHPIQLQRLAKRATVGLSRVGGWGSNTSGDIFLAFSTGNEIAREPGRSLDAVRATQMVPLVEDQSLNALFEAAADSVEEAIYNAVFMAEDTKGPLGREVKAIDLEKVKSFMEKYL